MASTEYWLISAPGDKTCQQTWEKMNNVTSAQNGLCVNHKFHLPDLKVGTLDQLMGLSDDLAKLDTYVESVTRKMAGYLGEVLEDQRDKLAENLLANQMDLATYLTRFQWEMAKFPIKQSVRGIVDAINNQVTQIENDLKSKSANYNNLKSNLANMERKQTGSLLTRNLGDLVKKEDFVQNSEYLVTLLVVVPKSFYTDWQAKYEHLADMVVPRSSRLIFEDNDHGLYTVTLFSKVVDEYKLHARENKFIVREFTYNEEELTAGKNELSKLINDKKRYFGPLVRWLKVNFSECFICWTHVKAIRVFVESVLRYGLPVNFQAILIHPNKKSIKRLRDILNQLYSHLDSSATGGVGETVDIPGLGFNTSEYYPYVYFKINTDMIGEHRP
ncbi:LOW QUALITY PROTEIN: V-type proton ATPase subunit C-like [Portunus trituberculatus]|uniref:LOW QUALITY PROTEIN: V-type proton ATPase subunit C-like n=1 Tax=Portunus trituberculatus TaxID=210409 RepID=UPI001E1CCC35|nr:LOW QUALITY PROTEIN: V-type proton ATPase subunit C-like [Portunus trituberculatus]